MSDLMTWIEGVVSWSDKHHGILTALATIAIAAFTGALFRATSRLWRETRRSISLARQAMRVSSKAYVFGDIEIAATIALEMIGPMPGTVMSRSHAGS